jgi:TolA-binding protein
MSDELESLRRQLAEAQENLKLIHERMHEYVMQEDIPLQLIKNERRLQQRITELEQRIAGESAQQPPPATPPQPSPTPGGDTINAPGAQGFVNRPTGEIHQYYGTVHINQGGPPPASKDQATEDVTLCRHAESVWPAAVREIGAHTAFSAALRNIYPISAEGDTVIIIARTVSYKTQLQQPDNRQIIEQLLSKHLGRTVRVSFIVYEDAP